MYRINSLLESLHYLDDIKVVLFDLDDTLYSEKDYVKSGYDKISKLFPEISNMSGKLWDAFCAKEKAIDFVLKKEGLYSEQSLKKCLFTYREQNPNITLYPKAKILLEKLKNKQLGMITDGRIEGQIAKIKALEAKMNVS